VGPATKIVTIEGYGDIVGYYDGHKGLNKICGMALTYQCRIYSTQKNEFVQNCKSTKKQNYLLDFF
jgi:hypothetical protein